MHRYYKNYAYPQPQYIAPQNDERLIGPALPFLGGALIGYFAGRPQYNYYPQYYPVYYPPYYYQSYPTYYSN